jgi:outer membrane murein-binding lipoprotein Lpp
MTKAPELQKGFTTAIIIFSVISISALVAGGVYSVNKLNNLEAENQELSERLSEQNEKSSEEVASSTDEVKSKVNEFESSSEQSISEKRDETVSRVYEPTPVSATAGNEIQAEVNTEDDATPLYEPTISNAQNENDSKEEIEKDKEASFPEAIFETKYSTQEIDTTVSSSTGNFEISINVKARRGDVFIPMTTNDSTFDKDNDSNTLRAKGDSPKSNLVGFQYSVGGDDFRGQQESEISCSLRNDDRCKIRSGESDDVVLKITIEPNQTGNYFIELDRITYIQNEDVKTFTLNEETSTLYLRSEDLPIKSDSIDSKSY